MSFFVHINAHETPIFYCYGFRTRETSKLGKFGTISAPTAIFSLLRGPAVPRCISYSLWYIVLYRRTRSRRLRRRTGCIAIRTLTDQTTRTTKFSTSRRLLRRRRQRRAAAPRHARVQVVVVVVQPPASPEHQPQPTHPSIARENRNRRPR